MALSKIMALLSAVAALLLLARESSHRGGGGDALLLLDGLHGVLDLATRRNMVLLCHAILLVLLGDAGILSSPARSRTKNAAVVAVEDPVPCWAATTSSLTTTEPERVLRRQVEEEEEEHVSTKEIVLVERQLGPSAEDGTTVSISPMDFHRAEELLPHEEECGEEEEEEEDLDEMNRRFEAFIAITKEKMRLEAMHPSSAENRMLLLA